MSSSERAKPQSESLHQLSSEKSKSNEERDSSEVFMICQIHLSSSVPEDPNEQFDRAFKYFEGKGVPVNKAKAADLFAKSASRGNGRAQFNIGLMYLHGDGVEKNPRRAEEYLKKAAQQKIPKAMFCLGTLYLKGADGVPKDKCKAAELFEKASDYDVKALFNLALMYLNGYGVKKDVKKACELFERGGEMNDGDSLYILGTIYDSGAGDVEEDKIKAFECFSKSANIGNAKAQFRLAQMYHNGEGCQANDEKARKFATQAYNGGVVEAQQFLSQLPVKSRSINVNEYENEEEDEEYDEYNESEPLAEDERIDDYFTNDKDQAVYKVFKSLEQRIKNVHSIFYYPYVDFNSALVDIYNLFIDRKISNVLSEFNQARNNLIEAEDNAYNAIAAKKRRKNRLPKLIRDDRGHISLDDSNGFLSLSEMPSSSSQIDDFDDELYKLGLDVRTLEHRLLSIQNQIDNSRLSQKKVTMSPMSSSSEGPKYSKGTINSKNSFDRFFGNNNISDSLEDSGSNSFKPNPPPMASNPNSPYQKRIKKIFE